MDKEDKSTVFEILEKTGFYSETHNRGLNLARMKDVLYDLPKAKPKISKSSFTTSTH